MQAKCRGMIADDDVRRWSENIGAKSVLTATVSLRNLGYYCSLDVLACAYWISKVVEYTIDAENVLNCCK